MATIPHLFEQAVVERRTRGLGPNQQEWDLCSASPAYFLNQYVQIYNATSRDWIPFHLWDAQAETLQTLTEEQLVVYLKARQLGASWLVLGYALWLMLFRPSATVLIFSKRDDEAVELLDFRLKGMHDRLPEWLRKSAHSDGKHQWLLSNGSRAMAFPTTGGRSYTASLVIVDEADFVPDLDTLLSAVKPTVDAGGQLVLLSTPDKSKPLSPFKRIYEAARDKVNEYVAIFHGWRARPDRGDGWYQRQQADVLARTGALDDLHQEYPESDRQALLPRTLDKRILAAWLEGCYQPAMPLTDPKMPDIPGLVVYQQPQRGQAFVVGADPAEGNPSSDDSAATVVDKATGEEMAVIAGKFEPTVFADFVDKLAGYFNKAGVLYERNNHGHSCIAHHKEHGHSPLLEGPDKREGWLSTKTSKIVMYDIAAKDFREDATTLHTRATYMQLASIDVNTLSAPEGQMDDRATSYALALAARTLGAPPPPAPTFVAVTKERAGNPFGR